MMEMRIGNAEVSLVAVAEICVPTLMSVTLAPGTTASAVSFTVPVTREFTVCPKETDAAANRHNASAMKLNLFMGGSSKELFS